MVAPTRRTGFEISTTFGEFLAGVKEQNAKIGFVFGHFELIHPGSLHMLRMAAEECDVLVVGIWIDRAFVEAFGREPLLPEIERSALVGFYKMVNAVIPYHPDELMSLIYSLEPNLVFIQSGNPFFLPADATFKVRVIPTLGDPPHGEFSTDHLLHSIRSNCFYYDNAMKMWAYNMPSELGFPTFYAQTLTKLMSHLKKNFNLEF